jgi:hypothetical protein
VRNGINSSRDHFSHIIRYYVFINITAQIKYIIQWFTRSGSRIGGALIVARYTFGFNDLAMLILGTVFILHMLWNCLLIIVAKESPFFGNDIFSVALHPNQLYSLDRIIDVFRD